MLKRFDQLNINHLNQDSLSYTLVDKNLIHLNENLDFSLFEQVSPTHMSLFLQSDTIIDRQQKKMISGVEQLYIRNSDMIRYELFLEKNLDYLLEDKSLSIDEKAELIYSSTAELTHSLYENPEALENVRRSQVIVAPIISTVLESEETIASYIKIIEYDYYTHTHSLNVSIYAICLGLELGLDEKTLTKLGHAALLHDLGKSKIDSNIVTKDGSLTQDEFITMKTHPTLGYEIAKKIGITDKDILDAIAHHHEKLNGRGYPDGLKGDEISLFPRIIAVCDVFDALTTNRTYKDALSSFSALGLMKAEMGTHLDQRVLNAFIKMLHS